MRQTWAVAWLLVLFLAGWQGAHGMQDEGGSSGFAWHRLPAAPTPSPSAGTDSRLANGVAVRAYPLHEHGIALRAGDLNGDGWADVALVTTQLRLRIWMQNPLCHELEEQIDVPVVPQPRDLAIGDLDGDGDHDLVVVGGWSDLGLPAVVHIFYQAEVGLATTPVTYTVAPETGSMRIGDVSGDGRADIVLASMGSLDVLVQQPGGTYQLTRVADYDTANQCDVAIADLNGDGRGDVALLNRAWPAAVLVYLQRSDGGSFHPAVRLAFAEDETSTSGIAAGDVTGDGRADLLVTLPYNSPYAHVVLFAGLPGGGFDAPLYLPTYDIPTSPVLADWNGDGRQDLIVLHATYGAVSVHLQQAGGGLGPRTTYGVGDTQVLSLGMRVLDAADLTGDGAVDVAFVSPLNGLVVATEGEMPDCADPPQSPGGHAPRFLYGVLSYGDDLVHDEIVAGDMTGDGLQDFVVTEQPYSAQHAYVRIVPQQPDGTFALGPVAFDESIVPTPANFYGLSVGDLNADGRLDIAAINSAVVVAYQKPDGTFQAAPVSVGTGPASWTGIADWTGDGRNDLGVVADAWYVLPQRHDGTLAPPVRHLAGEIGYTQMAYMGDWNRDGRADLYVWWPDESAPDLGLGDALRVLVQQADSSFAVETASCPGPTDIQMGDVTGDGRPDLLVSYERNAPLGVVWVLPQEPDGSIGGRTLLSAPYYEKPGGLVVTDLNANERQDLLVLNGWYYFSVLLQNDAGSLNPPLIYYDVPTLNNYYAHRAAVVDANQDGVADVIGVASPDQHLLFLKPVAYARYVPIAGKAWRPRSHQSR